MSEFEIPPKTDVSPNDPGVFDDKFLIGLPDNLIKTIFNHIKSIDAREQEEISKTRRKYLAMRSKASRDIKAYYLGIMNRLKFCFDGVTNFRMELLGEYSYYNTMPSLDNWKRDNPYIVIAIEYVFGDLRRKGYSPEIVGLDKWDMDEDGDYYGGRTLIIKCKLF